MTPRNLGVLAWLGVAAPIVYVATVVAGGASIAGYDHVRDPISSLTEVGRSGVEAIKLLFLAYNLLVAVFGSWAFATRPMAPRVRLVDFDGSLWASHVALRAGSDRRTGHGLRRNSYHSGGD